MAMDRIGPSPGVSTTSGFMGQMSARSIVQPQGVTSMAADDAPGFGTAAGLSRGASDTFQEQQSVGQLWGEKATRWGGREAVAQALNNALSRTTNQAPKFSTAGKTAAMPVKTYSQWFNLGNKSVSVTDFSMAKYKETVKANLKDVKTTFKADYAKKTFNSSALKEYGQKTLFNDNIKPVKDLLTNSPEKSWGTGLSRIFAFGVLGWDVAKNVKQTHDGASAEGKGAEHTTFETIKAAIKYILRAGLLWELAGIGMAFGKALLPIAFKSIPIGGILMGALFGAFGQTLLDPILGTGDHDKYPRAKEKKETPEPEAAPASG